MTPSLLLRRAALALLLPAAPACLAAQDDRSPGQGVRAPDRVAGVTFGEGGIVLRSSDSAYALTLRFRLQNLVAATSDEDGPALRDIEWSVRRARLWLGGQVADRRLTLLFQIGLSRRDQDAETWGYPVLVRDAFATWAWTGNLRTGLGVAKLPGNRNRVLSSADMLFPERGIVNNAFNLDRDFGLQAFWFDTLGRVPAHLSLAVTTGRGRAAPASRSAALTARAEVLPLGSFLRGNDYVEGGLLREPAPRLSVGLSVQQAWRTDRTGVTIGLPLASPADARTWYADALFKWQRLTVYGELAARTASSPDAPGESGTRAVVTGSGAMAQASWLLATQLDVAVRASWLWPEASLARTGLERQQQTSLALSRYLRGHRVKVQGELTRQLGVGVPRAGGARWLARVNLEVGI